jgi:hypothetical protein
MAQFKLDTQQFNKKTILETRTQDGRKTIFRSRLFHLEKHSCGKSKTKNLISKKEK